MIPASVFPLNEAEAKEKEKAATDEESKEE